MKADPMGTWTEQVSARMGWKSPATRKAAGDDSAKVCCNCKYRENKRIVKADDSVDFSPYCKHVDAPSDNGFATRNTAGCDRFSISRE